MTTDTRPVLVLGPGRMALHLIDYFQLNTPHRVEGFVHDQPPEEMPAELGGLPVFALEQVADKARTHLAVCYLGEPSRLRLARKAEALGFEFTSVIDPAATVDQTTTVGPGTTIGGLTMIDHHSRIGRHCIVGTHTVLGHDCVLEDFVTILPGNMIGGHTVFGEGAFVGMGCRIRDGVKIGRGAVVGIGSVVVKDVPEGVTVAGHPARPLERKPTVFGAPRSEGPKAEEPEAGSDESGGG